MSIASSIEPRTTVQERMDNDEWLNDAKALNLAAYREARNSIPERVKTEDDLDKCDFRTMKAMARALLKYDNIITDYMEEGQ